MVPISKAMRETTEAKVAKEEEFVDEDAPVAQLC